MKRKTLLSFVALAALLLAPQGVKAQITFDFDAAGAAGDALTTTEVTEHSYGYAYGGSAETPSGTTCKGLGYIYWIHSTANLNSRKFKFMNSSTSISYDDKGLYFGADSKFVIDGLTTGDVITINTKTDEDKYTTSRNLTGYKYEGTSKDSGTETGATISQNDVEVGYKGTITNSTSFTVTGGGSYIVLEMLKYQRIHSIVITTAGTTYQDKVEEYPFNSWYESAGSGMTFGSKTTMEGVYNHNSDPAADDANKSIYPILTYNDNDCSGHFAVTSNKSSTYYQSSGIKTGDSYFIFTGLHDGDYITFYTGGVKAGNPSYKYANLTTSSTVATLKYDGYDATEMVVGEESGNIPTATEVTITVTTAGNGYVALQGTGNSCYVRYATVTTKNGIVISSTGETLTVGEKGFATFCSNAHLDLTEVSNIIAYTAAEPSDGKVTMTPITIIPANTGVLLKSADGGAAEVTAPYYSSKCEAVSGNTLVGTLVDASVPQIVDSYTNYYLTTSDAEGTGDLGFYKCADGDGTTITAGKAYLQATTSTGARGLTFVFDDGSETTGINSVQSAERSVQSNEYYNLAGQRVAQPTKGLYIVNGKKVIIK